MVHMNMDTSHMRAVRGASGERDFGASCVKEIHVHGFITELL